MLGLSPVTSRKRSTMASLIFSVAKLRLFKGERWAVTSTLKVWLESNHSSQAKPLANLYKSSSCLYGAWANSSKTRLAIREWRLRAIAPARGAAKPTPPVGLVGVGSITHVPKAFESGRAAIVANSLASGTSSPPGQTTKNLMRLAI